MDVKRPKLALESAKTKSKLIFRSKIAETSVWKFQQKSQSRGHDVTKPATSIQNPITAHFSKPTSPIPASVFDPITSACFQEGTSEIEPLDTDLKAVKLLWWKVEQALRKRKSSCYTMPDNNAKRPAKILVFGTLSHDPKTETTTISMQLAKARAYDTQFRDLVLHPRGILSNKTEYRVLGEPYKYFQTSAPSGLHSAYYTPLHPSSSIWLDISPSHASLL